MERLNYETIILCFIWDHKNYVMNRKFQIKGINKTNLPTGNGGRHYLNSLKPGCEKFTVRVWLLV